ncbi:serine hydrolase domain-containing protein [Colwelliaceae bacterium 6471]
MFKNILLLLVLFLSNVIYAQSTATSATQIQKVLEDEELVGLTWSTISDGHVEVGSAGYANVSTHEAMKPEQKMHVGSVTKSVLAMGVLHLIYEGRLSLDSHVESLLPELNFDNAWRHRSPIKVQNLLDHTAGLDNIRMWQFLNTKPLPNTPLKNAFPSDNHHLLKVRTEPGTQYSYSNMGYTLLGMVIEAVTNQRYEAFLDNNLLAPLGMHDSSFEFISQQGQFADPMLAMGYHENNVAQVAVPIYIRPAGQFTTTAPDIAKFMAFLLNGGKVNGEHFISPEHMKMLTEPLSTHAYKAGLNNGHGLAFATRDRYGVLGMCHPGDTFGFSAFICLFPEQNKGFFYATNTDIETADFEKLRRLFVETLGVTAAPTAPPAESPVDLSELTGIYLLSPNNMAEFEYLDMLFGFIWLTPPDEHLLLSSLQKDDKRMIQVGDNLFRDVNRTQASHVVYSDDEGQLLISDGLKTFKRVSGLSLALYWLSLILGLIGLLYLFIIGLMRMIKRDKVAFGRIKWGFINLVLFCLPVGLFFNQGFLRFGDITAASISLAILTGLLPISLLISIWTSLKETLHGKLIKLDVAAIIMSLQLCVVLAVWGHIPTIFWQ